jgi:hypothetical protein
MSGISGVWLPVVTPFLDGAVRKGRAVSKEGLPRRHRGRGEEEMDRVRPEKTPLLRALSASVLILV